MGVFDTAAAQWVATHAVPGLAPPQWAADGEEGEAAAEGAADGIENTDDTNANRLGAVPQDGTQMAQMIPGVLGTVAGTVGSMAGALMGPLQQIPSQLMQVASAAGSSLGTLPADTVDSVGGYQPIDTGAGIAPEGVGTFPASGGVEPSSAPLPAGVTPVTGGVTPPKPVIPVGLTAPSVVGSSASSGMGMMPMPMGMGAGQPAGSSQAPDGKPSRLSTPAVPHTEAVAGKPVTDRLAASAAKQRDNSPVVRRVTIPEAKE